ncbi:hypothetical protein WG66_011817 [Moniliophthora roreri]|nr:hypothetical protein WG66_011817 [Moniliophthora roreri]
MLNSKALLSALVLACAYTVHADNKNSAGCNSSNVCGVTSPYQATKSDWDKAKGEWTYNNQNHYWYSASDTPGCFIDPKGFVDNHCGAAYLIVKYPSDTKGRYYHAKIDQLEGCCIPDNFWNNIQAVRHVPW